VESITYLDKIESFHLTVCHCLFSS